MKSLLVLQHLDRESPGFFSTLAKEFSLNLRICRVDLNDSFPSINEINGLLVLGGPMGLADLDNHRYSWLASEIQFIEKALLSEIPLIGVCLGAQLLAYVAGGSVETLTCEHSGVQYPEVGWAPITPLEQLNNEPVLRNFKSPLNVLHWHSDRIVLPESATLIASSDRCKEQMFRIGPASYGLQFHAELEGEMMNRWIVEDIDFVSRSLGDEGKSLLLRQQKIWEKKTQLRRENLLRDLFHALLS